MSDHTTIIFEASSETKVLTVSELNAQAKRMLEQGLGRIWVEGEVSNAVRAPSGHSYFSLKDEGGQIRCALFRRAGSTQDPLKNGDRIRALGRVSVYVPRGDYQLVVETYEAAGLGALHRAFEALKKKLSAEGLFDAQHKKPIPKFPKHLGVVTSPTGAAIQDILRVLRKRFPGLPVTIYPTLVQGKDAASQIVSAIATAQTHGRCDVLIVGRGGGSLEDLWPFNEEIVARAIFSCSIPVVSAVGHEIDTTIADFVADLRAPTPSAAAEWVSPDREECLHKLEQMHRHMLVLMRRRIEDAVRTLALCRARLKTPRDWWMERLQWLDGVHQKIVFLLQSKMHHAERQLLLQQQKLQSLSPHHAMVHYKDRLLQLERRLKQSMPLLLEQYNAQLALCAKGLDALSPLGVLGRGYAWVRDPSGKVCASIQDVDIGNRLSVRLKDGALSCVVENILEES